VPLVAGQARIVLRHHGEQAGVEAVVTREQQQLALLPIGQFQILRQRRLRQAETVETAGHEFDALDATVLAIGRGGVDLAGAAVDGGGEVHDFDQLGDQCRIAATVAWSWLRRHRRHRSPSRCSASVPACWPVPASSAGPSAPAGLFVTAMTSRYSVHTPRLFRGDCLSLILGRVFRDQLDDTFPAASAGA
jgi:hypothetical protein